jgi:hypothetical protein
MASFIPPGAPPVTYLAPINCAPSSTILPVLIFGPKSSCLSPKHHLAMRLRPPLILTVASPNPPSCHPFSLWVRIPRLSSSSLATQQWTTCSGMASGPSTGELPGQPWWLVHHGPRLMWSTACGLSPQPFPHKNNSESWKIQTALQIAP